MPATAEDLAQFDKQFGTSDATAPTPAHPDDLAAFDSKFGTGDQPNPTLNTSGMMNQYLAGQSGPADSPLTIDALNQSKRLHADESLVSRDFILPDVFSHEGYQAANKQDNIPLDEDTGASAATRLAVGLHRNKIEQLNVLRKLYGDNNVRLDTEGNFIIRQTDAATGKQKDLLVDERSLTLRDTLDLASEYPALAVSMLATKGVPVGAILKGALRAAIGYAAGGATTDVLARKVADQAVDPMEIAKARIGRIPFDTLFGYGVGKGVEAFGSLSTLGRLAGSKLADTTKASAMADIELGRNATEKRYGVTMEPSVAELTGNPTMIRIESFLSNIPIARNFILKKWARQIENEKAVQLAMFDGKLPDATAAGEGVINTLRSELGGTEAVAGQAANKVRGQAVDVLKDNLDAIPGSKLTPNEFGRRMSKRAETQLESFKERASTKFNAARTDANGLPSDANDALFSSSGLKQEADAIRKEELLNSTKATERVGYDQYGNPSAKVSLRNEPIKKLIPSGVDPILDSFKELNPKMSYFDLVKLRNAIYDRIGSPEPISSNGTRLLKKLGASVTAEMEKASTLLKPETYAKLKDANQFYKDNVETFYQKGIVDMLKPRTESGAVDPELIASRLLAGGKGNVTGYNTIKSFFEKPQAVEDVHRLLRDHVIDKGTDQATGLVKLEDLANAVQTLQPEIVQSLYGVPKDKLLGFVKESQLALKSNQGGKLGGVTEQGTQKAIEASALKDLFDSGKVSTDAIRNLVAANEHLGAQYSNSIRAAVKANDFGVIEAAPETFVKKYLYNPATSLADVRDVMDSIHRTGDSELIGNVRRAYLTELFNDSAKISKGDTGQLVARANGSPLRDLDPQKFALNLQDQATRARMESVLGKETFTGVTDFAKAIGGRATRDLAGSTVGAFAGGSLFEKMLSGLDGLAEMPKYIALSWLTTSPRVVAALRGAAKGSRMNLDSTVKAALLTPEFLHVLASDSKSPDEARDALEQIKKLGTK